MTRFNDFPIAPEGHETALITRSYIWGGYSREKPHSQSLMINH